MECGIYVRKVGGVNKISEIFKRRFVDICCLQKVRWKGKRAKTIGIGFKFLWSGSCKAENGVGVIVANWSIGEIVGVERYNNRVMKVNIVIGMYSFLQFRAKRGRNDWGE